MHPRSPRRQKYEAGLSEAHWHAASTPPDARGDHQVAHTGARQAAAAQNLSLTAAHTARVAHIVAWRTRHARLEQGGARLARGTRGTRGAKARTALLANLKVAEEHPGLRGRGRRPRGAKDHSTKSQMCRTAPHTGPDYTSPYRLPREHFR